MVEVYVDKRSVIGLIGIIHDIEYQLAYMPANERDDVDYNAIINQLRDYVNVNNAKGFYQCNIFPEYPVEYKISYDEFCEYMSYVERAERNTEPFLERTCVDCGEKFTLFKSEVGFFQQKGLALPKRCKECRRKRKLMNNTTTDRVPRGYTGQSVVAIAEQEAI